MTIPTDDLKWLSKNARRKYRRGEMSEEKARKIIANNKNSDVIHITSTAIISKLRENSEFIMSPRIWSFPEDVMRIWINNWILTKLLNETENFGFMTGEKRQDHFV